MTFPYQPRCSTVWTQLLSHIYCPLPHIHPGAPHVTQLSYVLDKRFCLHIRPSVLSHLLNCPPSTSSWLFFPRSPQLFPSYLFSTFPPAHQPNCFSLFPPSAGSSLLVSLHWFSFPGTFTGSGRAILGPPKTVSLTLLDGSPCSVPASLTHVVSRGMACGCLILGSYPAVP